MCHHSKDSFRSRFGLRSGLTITKNFDRLKRPTSADAFLRKSSKSPSVSTQLCCSAAATSASVTFRMLGFLPPGLSVKKLGRVGAGGGPPLMSELSLVEGQPWRICSNTWAWRTARGERTVKLVEVEIGSYKKTCFRHRQAQSNDERALVEEGAVKYPRGHLGLELQSGEVGEGILSTALLL